MAVSVRLFPRFIIYRLREEQGGGTGVHSIPVPVSLKQRRTRGSGSFPCTHSEVMRDGTPHFTLCLNGLLTFDLSREVDLRWKGLPGKTGRDLLAGIWVFVLFARVFTPHPETESRNKMATFALALTASSAFCSLVLRWKRSEY